MKRVQKIMSLLVFSTIIFLGCSKDDDNDTPDPVVPSTNMELLTAKTWQGGETYQNLSGTRFHYLRVAKIPPAGYTITRVVNHIPKADQAKIPFPKQ